METNNFFSILTEEDKEDNNKFFTKIILYKILKDSENALKNVNNAETKEDLYKVDEKFMKQIKRHFESIEILNENEKENNDYKVKYKEIMKEKTAASVLKIFYFFLVKSKEWIDGSEWHFFLKNIHFTLMLLTRSWKNLQPKNLKL